MILIDGALIELERGSRDTEMKVVIQSFDEGRDSANENVNEKKFSKKFLIL